MNSLNLKDNKIFNDLHSIKIKQYFFTKTHQQKIVTRNKFNKLLLLSVNRLFVLRRKCSDNIKSKS